MSDHSGLQYLFDQSNTNGTQTRWLATISEFNFNIRYIKGKEEKVADALSKHTGKSLSSYELLWDRLTG